MTWLERDKRKRGKNAKEWKENRMRMFLWRNSGVIWQASETPALKKYEEKQRQGDGGSLDHEKRDTGGITRAGEEEEDREALQNRRIVRGFKERGKKNIWYNTNKC